MLLFNNLTWKIIAISARTSRLYGREVYIYKVLVEIPEENEPPGKPKYR
jgi:hypothetical protein